MSSVHIKRIRLRNTADQLAALISDIKYKREGLIAQGVEDEYFVIMELLTENVYYIQFRTEGREQVRAELRTVSGEISDRAKQHLEVLKEQGWNEPDEETAYLNHWKVFNVGNETKILDMAWELRNALRNLYGYSARHPVSIKISRFKGHVSDTYTAGGSLSEFTRYFFPVYERLEWQAYYYRMFTIAFVIFGICWIFISTSIDYWEKGFILVVFGVALLLQGAERYRVGVFDSVIDDELMNKLMRLNTIPEKTIDNMWTRDTDAVSWAMEETPEILLEDKVPEYKGSKEPVYAGMRSIIAFALAYLTGLLVEELGDVAVFLLTVFSWLAYTVAFYMIIQLFKKIREKLSQ